MKLRLFVNPEPCTGCLNCMMVCSQHRSGLASPNASAIRVDLRPFSGDHVIHYCHQCKIPPCKSACRFEAFELSDNGTWRVNRERCTGCGDCTRACPFNAMMLDLETSIAFKCDHCGGTPECVRACHFGVIHWCTQETEHPVGIPREDIDPKLGRG